MGVCFTLKVLSKGSNGTPIPLVRRTNLLLLYVARLAMMMVMMMMPELELEAETRLIGLVGRAAVVGVMESMEATAKY